ncbi:hypothetical protein AZH53_09600 [Methanomicrobiaceae archaeon CYW5]|uniref:TIM barrel protein n=1 Tax=Methanovulcanius yangii TaxID=1789227 RepID=UPI0029C9C0EB|nr:TIM barrel protein [Methanovulcanius yangii]MBT8508658.1 hypothetical protein [Methanovulcanius yangii]
MDRSPIPSTTPAPVAAGTAPHSYSELINLAVYPWDRARFGGTWEDVARFCAAHGCAGVELYTGYEPMPEDLPPGLVRSVHLPFHSAWPEMMAAAREEEQEQELEEDGTAPAGDPNNATTSNDPGNASVPDPLDPSFFPHTTHASLLAALRLQLERAAEAGAAYAVYHVGYYQPVEMFLQTYAMGDAGVLDRAADFLNELARAFPEGEPPVPLMFENLWYPGLTYTDPDAVLSFMDRLAFKGYGFLLDTGHLMNAVALSDDEDDCIDAVCDCIRALPPAIVEKIGVVHLHWSGSHSLRQERRRRGVPNGFFEMARHDQETLAFQHAVLTDQHRPFTSERCGEIVEAAAPEWVVHEFIAGTAEEHGEALRAQREALGRRRRV